MKPSFAINVHTNWKLPAQNAGRACWVVIGTLCGGAVQSEFADKLGNCMKCDFYKLVQKEQSSNFQIGENILEKLV